MGDVRGRWQRARSERTGEEADGVEGGLNSFAIEHHQDDVHFRLQ